MQPETKAERQARLARERKQKSRDRLRSMQMAEMRLELSQSQRDLINEMARLRGFDGATEYLYWLTRADKDLMGCDSRVNPAAECVTRHVREFSARCETPDIGEVV